MEPSTVGCLRLTSSELICCSDSIGIIQVACRQDFNGTLCIQRPFGKTYRSDKQHDCLYSRPSIPRAFTTTATTTARLVSSSLAVLCHASSSLVVLVVALASNCEIDPLHDSMWSRLRQPASVRQVGGNPSMTSSPMCDSAAIVDLVKSTSRVYPLYHSLREDTHTTHDTTRANTHDSPASVRHPLSPCQ
jgi:hypothetical protein